MADSLFDILGWTAKGQKMKRENQRIVGDFAAEKLTNFQERHGKEIADSLFKSHAKNSFKNGKVDSKAIVKELGATVAVYAMIDILVWAKENYWDK